MKNLKSMQAGYEYSNLLECFFADDSIKVGEWNPKTNTIIVECDDPQKFHMLDIGLKKDAIYRDVHINVEVKYTGLSNVDGLTEHEYDLLLTGNRNYEGLMAGGDEENPMAMSVVFKELPLHWLSSNLFDPWLAEHALAQDVAKIIFKKKVPFSTMINFPKEGEE